MYLNVEKLWLDAIYRGMPKLCRLLVFRRLVQEKDRIAIWNLSDDEDESLSLFINWCFLLFLVQPKNFLITRRKLTSLLVEEEITATSEWNMERGWYLSRSPQINARKCQMAGQAIIRVK